MASNQSSGEQSKKPSGPSLLEWLSGAAGALLATGILAFIAFEALDQSSENPPLLQVRPVEAARAGDSFIIEVQVSNRSGQTAAAVEVEGELLQGGSTVETSNASIAYVPGHSERNAGLIFTRDPRAHQLQVRVTGYEEP